MDITVLKEQIMKNNLSNLYIFTGEEIGIQNIYLNQMSKVLGLPITRAESVLSIYSQCTSKTLFGNSRGFYVIRNDFDIQKQEKFYENLSNEIKNNVIVLLYEKIDSRLKFGKFFKDRIVQFEKLPESILKKYIKNKINLSEKNLENLSNKVSGSYDVAMLEVDKINQFSSVSGLSADKAFEKLCADGVIYQPQEHDVFEFVDCVCNRLRRSFDLAKVLADNNVSSINILGTLYNSFKSILLIQCCTSDICNTTGLDNRQVYFNKKYVGKYGTSELVAIVKLLAKLVSDVKTGYIDDMYAVNYALVNIL